MMKNILGAACLLVVGCGGSATSYVRAPDTTLGRVIVYRNGVAYFERVAQVEGDSLKLSVPADKVDDFLKSLTVVDAKTGEPAPIAYPTNAPATGTGLIDMKINLRGGGGSHALKLSYVTEAPSWKPSYRLTVGKQGRVDVQGWAIVDNTSGEDWNNIRLGVGSSSAMSFRFDLRSVRMVQRETLQSNDLFAQAPPMGGSTYGKDSEGKKIVGDFSDDALALNDKDRDGIPEQSAAFKQAPSAAAAAADPSMKKRGHAAPAATTYAGGAAAPPAPPNNGLTSLARAFQGQNRRIVIEGYAGAGDSDKYAASLDRANKMREQFVRNGVDANNIVAIGKGEQTGHNGGVRVVEAQQDDSKAPDQAATPVAGPVAPADPIGTSHFESGVAMSVARGTSAMVSILHTDTEGEVVYLFDAESARGNSTFPFKAVRIKNPTDSELESGPVTVFGDGRFIGEGMSEAIPARSTAFVPFALDRQIVVEKGDDEKDEIERILTVQRGVFSTEMRRTRKSTLTLQNRTSERATVYVRHTVAQGYKLTKSPEASEKIAGAHLFRVVVEPNKKTEVVIEETTPVFKSTDIRTPAGLDMVRVYLSSAAVAGPLKQAVADLLKLHQDMAKIEQQIATTRDQMAEYRVRMDELHVQIVTLKAVKSGGPLMKSLETKLSDISDKISKSTIDLVGYQEKLMVSRINFQDGVAEISLEKPAPSLTATK